MLNPSFQTGIPSPDEEPSRTSGELSNASAIRRAASTLVDESPDQALDQRDEQYGASLFPDMPSSTVDELNTPSTTRVPSTSVADVATNGNGSVASVDSSVAPFLTTAIKPVIEPLVAIARSKIAEVGIPVHRIEWSAFKRRDSKQVDVILKVFVTANRQQALAFWEYLGSRLDEWIDRLPPSSARMMMERVSTEVVWKK